MAGPKGASLDEITSSRVGTFRARASTGRQQNIRRYANHPVRVARTNKTRRITIIIIIVIFAFLSQYRRSSTRSPSATPVRIIRTRFESELCRSNYSKSPPDPNRVRFLRNNNDNRRLLPTATLPVCTTRLKSTRPAVFEWPGVSRRRPFAGFAAVVVSVYSSDSRFVSRTRTM